jgi:hypothetical protein
LVLLAEKGGNMQRIINGTVIALCIFLCISSSLSGKEVAEQMETPYSEATGECIECHMTATAGIYWDWLKSRHAVTTPKEALTGAKLKRRISSEDIPDNLLSVGVGCYECHSLNVELHKDRFDHFGYHINVIVTPNDCRTCHSEEVEQYSHSKKAYALEIMTLNPVYQTLIKAIVGDDRVDGVTSATMKAGNLTARGTPRIPQAADP